jgi:HPt (histidine-containing phosphotransfer) domain-containing protein
MEKLGGDRDVYLKVLASFAKNTPPLLDKLSDSADSPPVWGGAGGGGLDDYRITVHGIKSSARSVGAAELGDEAEALEGAAAREDGAFIEARNAAFTDTCRELIAGIKAWFENPDFMAAQPSRTAEAIRERRQAPDKELLARLGRAAAAFDIDGVNSALDELAKYDYDQGAELIDFIKQRLTVLDFKAIAHRIQEV